MWNVLLHAHCFTNLDLIMSIHMLIVGYYNFDVDLRSGRRFARDEGATAVLPGS